MRLIKAFNKEQLTALGVAVVCGLLLLGGLAGGESVEVTDYTVGAEARTYQPPQSRFGELPGPDFAKYWRGRDIFRGEVAKPMDLPVMALPHARVEMPSAPPLASGPRLLALRKIRVAHGIFYLDPAHPVTTPGRRSGTTSTSARWRSRSSASSSPTGRGTTASGRRTATASTRGRRTRSSG
ncbi:MAG: hypothetical protein ACYTAF_16165 [Planctomycetota bacterium]